MEKKELKNNIKLIIAIQLLTNISMFSIAMVLMITGDLQCYPVKEHLFIIVLLLLVSVLVIYVIDPFMTWFLED